MSKLKDQLAVFIHRRDLRVYDNLALNKLACLGLPVLHIFIINPVQCRPKYNAYYNKNAIEFMVHSLQSLHKALDGNLLICENSSDTKVLEQIEKHFRAKIHAVGYNTDVTQFARNRDDVLDAFCKKKQIQIVKAEDYTLFPMKTILNKSGRPYQVFTPFYKVCIGQQSYVAKPTQKKYQVYKIISKGASLLKPLSVNTLLDYLGLKPNEKLAVAGGREKALKRLAGISKDTSENTMLSAYIKFGCVSIREVFHNLQNESLKRQLIWREFYAHLTWHGLHSGKWQKAGHAKHVAKHVAKHTAILSGMTGVPIVDASIRELTTTGWISNRMRMIVASFICNDLGLDWRIYEKELFGKHLVDYDPSVNTHSWQSMAGATSWSKLNVWRQARLYDKKCEYIKKWIPELANQTPRVIHTWHDLGSSLYKKIGYSMPILSH